MSDTSTKHIIDMYMEEADAPMFLSGFFDSPPRNFHTTEMVEIDIERDEEDVAVVVTDLSTGARANEATTYTNKGFIPPIFDEKGAIKAYDMLKRAAGANPYDDPQYDRIALKEAFRIFRKLEKKIRRAIELMSSQVMQSAVLTLKDQDGVALYTLDFQPKSTHFPTAAAAWGGGSDNPMADIAALATVIRRDGKRVPNQIVFGSRAWDDFKGNAKVQAVANLRRADLADIRQPRRGEEGASYHGTFTIGQYVYELWTYDGYYKDPQTGVLTPYLGQDKVIVRATTGRLDLSYGAIPRVAPPDPRAMPFLPPRMSSPEQGLDLTTFAWIGEGGKQLMVSAGTRPLTIPTAIDTFGCLTTR